MTAHIVGLMGSYRRHGAIETTLDAILEHAQSRGATTSKIVLVDRNVKFCGNCRACTQAPGTERGQCVIDDDASGILSELEAADAIVLAASVNFGDVNARVRQLLERMVGFGYWPWGQPAPRLRRASAARKPAILVASSAAPGWMTKLFARPFKTLREMAKLLGARPIASIAVGLAAGRPEFEPGPKIGRQVERAVDRLDLD